MYSELKTIEWDILNPDYLIWVSNVHTFDFLLKPFFLGYRREKSKTGRAKFQIYRLHIRDSDWLNFVNFSGYKYKIRLVSILKKREDQAFISISTILKFSALFLYLMGLSGLSFLNTYSDTWYLVFALPLHHLFYVLPLFYFCWILIIMLRLFQF